MTVSAPQEQGVAFPADEDGRISTMALNQDVFADAARGTSPELASEITRERDWRASYVPYIRRLLQLGMVSADNAIAISADGLQSLRSRMVFRRGDDVTAIDAAMQAPSATFGTATVHGRGRYSPRLAVPYHGRELTGDALRRQLDDWVERGIAEPSFAEAVALVVENPDWLDLSDQSVAVLGAGSEMGPFAHLCQWGANIWALDLPRPQVWRRVLSTAVAGRGSVRVPLGATERLSGQTVGAPGLDELSEVAGANLIESAPELRAWLAAVPGPLTVGNYVYADSGLHVRASVAADAIMTGLQADRDDLTLAFLATPTDVFSVPWDVVEDARRRYRQRSLAAKVASPVGAVSAGRVLAEHYARHTFPDADPPFGVADNLVPQQGPNYALAKRMQRWRATVAREQGVTASLNIAPPTRTASVLKNRAFSLAYAGMSRFGLEVFDPAASNALMAAMLVHDLRNPSSSAHPGTALDHPLDHFVDGANPGGMWRCPYEPNSVMTAAAVAGLFERRA
jgi:hypothetical protein